MNSYISSIQYLGIMVQGGNIFYFMINAIFLFFIMPRLQPKRNKATVAIHKSLSWLLTLYFVNFCLWIFPELLQGKCGYYQIDKVYPDYNTFLEYLDLAILPLSMVFASTMIMSRMPKPWIIPSILFPYMLYALNDIYGILPFKFYKFAYITTIIVVVVQLAWYAFFIKKFNKRLKDNYSDLDRRNIKWILLTLVPLSLLSILYIPLTMMSNVDELMIIYDLLTFLILSNIVGCALSYKVDDMTIELIDEQMDEIKKEKNQKVDVAASDNSKTQPSSNLSNKFLNFDEIFQKLEEECFYLDTEVNIDWISSKLGTNRHYVSDYLNRVKHVTFYEYVNTLRLIHAERLLKEGNEKMADIAFICGFNSDHTFRRLFKERYGCTPLQYQKSA